VVKGRLGANGVSGIMRALKNPVSSILADEANGAKGDRATQAGGGRLGSKNGAHRARQGFCITYARPWLFNAGRIRKFNLRPAICRLSFRAAAWFEPDRGSSEAVMVFPHLK
jgi:hypothetical protein